jgi:hypothetical protein
MLVCLLTVLGRGNVTSGGKTAISQKDFGIIPNCPEDQTDRIQEYLNAIALRDGGQAYLSAGYYVINGSLTIPTAVSFTGSWSAPHHGILSKGTVLHAYGGRNREDGPALLEMEQSSAVNGLTIVYPKQKLADVKPYPWTIHGRGMHNTIENVTLVNSYQGIRIGPESNELHLIRNVFGCVLRRGILIDNTTDIGRIENVHFNPHYWPRSGHNGVPKDVKPNQDIAVAIYMQQHLEAFIFARTDWEYVTNTFVFGAKVGYHFISGEKGGCNGQFHGIGADMCQYCVLVDKTNPYGILISNGQFVAGQLKSDQAHDRVGIYTSPAFVDGVVQMSNCTFWGCFTNIMRLQGSGCTTICQANFKNDTPGKAAVDITNNFARNGVKIINNAADRLTAADNE